jgi:putative sigma-54 modulation protein
VNLILKGHGVDLNDRLRDYATEKLTKAQRLFERIIRMDVVFSEERNPRVKLKHRVEVTVKTPGETLRAEGAGLDYFAAIDRAHGRLETQVRKFKGRLVARTQTKSGNHAPAPAPARRRAAAKNGGPEIIRTSQFAKPMSPEEAVVELGANGDEILVFRNRESREIAVVYRRPDGKFGLVEPEV